MRIYNWRFRHEHGPLYKLFAKSPDSAGAIIFGLEEDRALLLNALELAIPALQANDQHAAQRESVLKRALPVLKRVRDWDEFPEEDRPTGCAGDKPTKSE
jgi:hypothetical protein